MCLSVPDLQNNVVASLVKDLNTQGFACIPSYLQPQDLDRMQNFARNAVKSAGNEYVHFVGPQSVTGSGLEELADCRAFRSLIHRVFEMGTGEIAKKEEFYQVLRCLTGSTGQKNSLIFHYDSYVITALVPIHIPDDGLAGDLLMYPNTRGIRHTYAANVVDKVLLDNPATQWALRTRVNASWLKPLRIKMQPGGLYLFWGYRSIHTNEPCDPDKLRATALFHYHNPHKPQTVAAN
jgi:hypothetical protein